METFYLDEIFDGEINNAPYDILKLKNLRESRFNTSPLNHVMCH